MSGCFCGIHILHESMCAVFFGTFSYALQWSCRLCILGSSYNYRFYNQIWHWLFESIWFCLVSRCSRMTHVLKEGILQYLHGILFHLRPLYNTQSVCACWYALLHHVHSQILYLVSLSVRGFYDEEICFQNNIRKITSNLPHLVPPGTRCER